MNRPLMPISKSLLKWGPFRLKYVGKGDLHKALAHLLDAPLDIRDDRQ